MQVRIKSNTVVLKSIKANPCCNLLWYGSISKGVSSFQKWWSAVKNGKTRIEKTISWKVQKKFEREGKVEKTCYCDQWDYIIIRYFLPLQVLLFAIYRSIIINGSYILQFNTYDKHYIIAWKNLYISYIIFYIKGEFLKSYIYSFSNI